MMASSADTAELPLLRDPGVAFPPPAPGPAPGPPAPGPSPAISVPDAPVVAITIVAGSAGPATAVPPVAIDGPAVKPRAERRAERASAVRERRLYALLGLSSMAVAFAAAVTVLDVIH